MLEAYQAYGDYETMMELLQSMICHVSEKVCGTLVIEQKDAEGNVTQTIDLTPDWRRAKYKDLICEKAMQKGLLLIHTGRESIKLAPPLTITEDALVEGLEVLDLCIDEAMKDIL